MPSPSLLAKIAKQRAAAPSDLPLVRRCAAVVLAWLAQEGEGSPDLSNALSQLRDEYGSNWSLVTALQLLSGRRGQFAIECGLPGEKALLYLAHLVAKSAGAHNSFSTMSPPNESELARLREMACQRLTSDRSAV